MRDAEWRLRYPGTDFTFGTRETPTFNRTTPDLGDIDIRIADVDRPRGDGVSFGMDYRGGRTISFDLGVRAQTELAARDEAARLITAWRADRVRLKPGSVAELTARYAGRERVVYGRPRRLAPDYSDVAVNCFVGVTADFACVDDLFYDPEWEEARMTTSPQLGGGLLAPLAAPLSTTLNSDRSAGITVATDLPAWPVIEIHGPITNPGVEIVGVFKVEVQAQLVTGDVAVIDTRPWVRSAKLNNWGSLGGAVRGTRLSQVRIPAGNHEVVLRGLDPSGTASAVVRWQRAYSTL